jgi:hypothetical protein
MLIKLRQPLPRSLLLCIHAVDFNTMATTRDMKTPVPTVSDFHWLCIETIVPAAHDELGPAFVIAGDFTFVGAPGVFVLGREILYRHGIPHVTTIGGDFNTFGPATPTRVSPAWSC